jgi:putative endonuclease
MRFPLSWEVNMAQHNELGKKGEQLAVDFLLQQGYAIMERNYRFQKAEVDIIAKKEDTLAIIEVKTRSTSDFGNPQDFVKPKQIQRLVKAVDEYVTVNNLDVEVRFDIIAITKQGKGFNIEHLENAFYHF